MSPALLSPIIQSGTSLVEMAGGAIRRRRARKEAGKLQAGIEDMFGNTPQYQVPEESQQMLEMFQDSGGQIRDLAQQSTDLAESRTGVQEAPGASIMRENIAASGATAAQRAVEAGGSSASSLGAIADIQKNELSALRDQGIQNQSYRANAEQGYQQALMQQAGAESSAAGLESAGLQEMIRQREQQFQVNEVDPFYNELQYKMTNLGNVQAQSY